MQWNPWHGCRKCSPGCKNCYVYYLDSIHGRDGSVITRSKTAFDLPLKKDRHGNYKIPPGREIATCFTSDFFLEDADQWRDEAWEIIRRRSDVVFFICTKRIERLDKCLPDDWGDGYENVSLAVTCENQQKADERMPIFLNIKARRKSVLVSPILERVDLGRYLAGGGIDLVSVGGESYENARLCDFEWVKFIKRTCDRYGTAFDFHQTGSNFLMNGRRYKIQHRDEYAQAKKGMLYLENLE
jgi:protein gp37